MSAILFKVKAVHEYSSPHDDDLQFAIGQVINVTAADDDDWYTGEYSDSSGQIQEGLFPRNFVEKYEPEIPARPSRPTKARQDAEPSKPAAVKTPAPEPALEAPGIKGDIAAQESVNTISPESGVPTTTLPTQLPPGQPSSDKPPKAAAQPQRRTSTKAVPPPVADKSGVGSFRDRIAAFNKPAAPPVAPFKPGGPGANVSAGFIKKPYVAPPPSKNAYVPPPTQQPAPARVYRREEDPGMNETAEDSEASMPRPNVHSEAEVEPDSKPTSLKDRIALLQKQQLEQAARHAEAAQKKEKPKRPPKKRADSQEAVKAMEQQNAGDPEEIEATDTAPRKSVDFAPDENELVDGQEGHQVQTASQVASPPAPSRELLSDANDADNSAAGDTEDPDTSTSRDDDRARAGRIQAAASDKNIEAEADESDEEVEAEDEDDEAVDPEVKRRLEIRERMAKMSGGMGMMGMFGPPGGMPPPGKKARPTVETERAASGSQPPSEIPQHAPPVPVPGMSNIGRQAPDISHGDDSGDEKAYSSTPYKRPQQRTEESDEDVPDSPTLPPRTSTDRSLPPVPQARAVPPLPQKDPRSLSTSIPTEKLVPDLPTSPPGRSVPPPPPRISGVLSPGELSDDELSASGSVRYDEAIPVRSPNPSYEMSPASTPAPVPPTRPERQISIASPTSPSPTSPKEKRVSRGLPPLPPSSPIGSIPPQTRGPPPPPPGQPPSRKSTSQSRNMPLRTRQEIAEESEEEVTEYDGDYDTDIASSAKHKDALKSHARDSSLDDDTLLDPSSPAAPSGPPGRGPPPLPSISAPRDVPPPPPTHQPGKQSRTSSDIPRGAPPPIPGPKEPQRGDEDDYDPYRYSIPQQSSPTTVQAVPHSFQYPNPQEDVEDVLDPPRASRAAPPPPGQVLPSSPSMPVQQSTQGIPRPSGDISRSQTTSRRSLDAAPRPSGEHGIIATDIDLAPSSLWYAQTPDVPPAPLQRRNDILYEIESSTSSKRGGKTTISKDVYVLYMDYSQTVITAAFDPLDPTNASLEQRHERPPPAPRQDQLEAASSQFGSHIASAASSKSGTTVADGSPHSLILDLLTPFSSSALLPVGTRAYGSCIYSNLANASTTQQDEIRPGDIITFRNAKFAGHKGGLHTKYTLEVGRPERDHVAVVADWDGTKKKLRVWEQRGKEAGGKGGVKVKEESYRVPDLKSGEVRVWRVMGRGWVGWDSAK